MAKREPLRIPLGFEEALSDLLKVKPPEKADPPKKRAKKKAAKKR
jgi:hypothetical protein